MIGIVAGWLSGKAMREMSAFISLMLLDVLLLTRLAPATGTSSRLNDR